VTLGRHPIDWAIEGPGLADAGEGLRSEKFLRPVGIDAGRQAVGLPVVDAVYRVAGAEIIPRTGFEGETEASVNSKLVRGTFAVTFFLGTLAVLELEGVQLEDL
jgi:hypothetical protein